MLNNKETKEKIYKLRNAGNTWRDIGIAYGIDRTTARRWYEKYEREGYTGADKEPTRAILGPQFDLSRFQPVHVYGDAAVTCDWHVPLHDPKMVNALFKSIDKMNIHQLIVAGDLFNMDNFSSFRPYQSEAGFEFEREEVTNLISAALDVVDEVIFTWGNHDFRMVRALDFRFSFKYCMEWCLSSLPSDKLSRVVISDLDHMIYHPGNYDVYVCHPENFSSIPLTVSRALVPKYGMSVLTAHSHHFAQGVALDGKNLLFDGGGLFSSERTQYIKRTNRHHRWVQGYYIWKDGICHPFSPIYHNC